MRTLLEIRRQWNRNNLIRQLLFSLGCAFLSAAAAYWLINLGPVLLLTIFLLAGAFAFFGAGSWQRTDDEVCRLLSDTYPELEDSSYLLLKPAASLGLLERLQAEKLNTLIPTLDVPPAIRKKLPHAALFLLVTVLLGLLMVFNPWQPGFGKNNMKTNGQTNKSAAPEVHLPGVSALTVRIDPPAYTGLRTREQDQFGLTAEAGSRVYWEIRMNGAPQTLTLRFNDKLRFPLKQAGNSWTGSRELSESGFYQLEIDGKLSDLYKLEVTADRAPVLRIVKPAQYTTIDFGQPQQTNLQVMASDDYGLTSAGIHATIASGSGESVKFREQQLRFSTSFAGTPKTSDLRKLIDLGQLGMQPGDELYFYVEATDNRAQRARTDMYFVSIADTADLMSMDISMNAISNVPEYFRSQRQIIIDTEKLLREKAGLTTKAFNDRSNNIGIDQHLLRLRYSKFLGDENADSDGHPDEHHEEGSSIVPFGDTKVLEEQLSHKHDQGEDINYFEPKQKAQLRSILNEMWASETNLRTFFPDKALPSEYKALRLLKELQQQARSYVAKTSFKAPPLKPEKRLTGEQDKILAPVTVREPEKSAGEEAVLANASRILEQLKLNVKPSAADLTTLRRAAAELGGAAAANPGTYLGAASGFRKVIGGLQAGKVETALIPGIQFALQRLIPGSAHLPVNAVKRGGGSLADNYFQNLKANE